MCQTRRYGTPAPNPTGGSQLQSQLQAWAAGIHRPLTGYHTAGVGDVAYRMVLFKHLELCKLPLRQHGVQIDDLCGSCRIFGSCRLFGSSTLLELGRCRLFRRSTLLGCSTLLGSSTLLRNSAALAAAEILDEWEQNCIDMEQLEASSQKAVRVHLWSRDSIRVCNCTTQTLTDQAVDDVPSSRYDELFLPKSDQQGSIRIDLSSTNNNTKLHS